MNTKKLRTILIDQDGVLAGYNDRLLEIFQREHPEKLHIPPEGIIEHETERNFPSSYHPIFEEISLRKGFYRSLPPVHGGKAALDYMLAQGYDVRICTAPKREFQNCTLEKLEWIEEHFGRTWTDRTIITRDKTLVSGDILIDDKPNITGVEIPTWEHVLYDQPYNRTQNQRRLTWANYKEILEI